MNGITISENENKLPISELLDQLAISSLNNSLEIVSRGDELWPIVILAAGEDFDVQQFADDAPEECYEAACAYVAQAGAEVDAYAICIDGHAEMEYENDRGELETQTSDALIIEFGERGEPASWSMITPYLGADAPGGFEIIGDTGLVEEQNNLLSSPV